MSVNKTEVNPVPKTCTGCIKRLSSQGSLFTSIAENVHLAPELSYHHWLHGLSCPGPTASFMLYMDYLVPKATRPIFNTLNFNIEALKKAQSRQELTHSLQYLQQKAKNPFLAFCCCLRDLFQRKDQVKR